MSVRFQFEYGNSVLSLPKKVLEHISKASVQELQVLVALAGESGEIAPEELAAKLGIRAVDVENALTFWRGAGILSVETEVGKVVLNEHISSNGNTVRVVQSGESPHYTGKEIEALFAENTQLRSCIDETSRILGKVLSVDEINKLIGLVDSYRLSCEYVLLLTSHCKKIGKGSIPFIFRMALAMYEAGIVTVEGLEEKIRFDEERKGLEYKLRSLIGAGGRAFTEKEKKFISGWTEWKIPDSMLEMVYQIAVDNTGKPSMPYMNKVLSNWREAGYKTAEDAQNAMEQYRQKKANASNLSSFNEDEFFEAALRHSLELHSEKPS
jgi:DnaD/phage-associated family protein